MRRIICFSTLLTLPLLAPSGTAHADSASAFEGTVQPMATGEDVYHHVCQGCHMPDGRGAVGASARFPALAGNARLQVSAYPIYVIMNGYGGMPWFSEMLTDQQIAGVVGYIRMHFGNNYTDPVTPADVTPQRPAIPPKEIY